MQTMRGENGKDNNYMEISAFEKQMKYLSDNNYYYPSWDEVYQFVQNKKTLPKKSVVITIHSHDMHRAGKDRFLTMTHDEAYNDLMTTQKIIGSNDVFCYPYGDYNDFTKKMLKATGYKLALTTRSGRVYPGMDKLALPRLRMSKGDPLSYFIARVK